MDREVFWLPGWEERSRDAQLKQIERIIAQEAWVFEGSNSRTYHIREARAEMLVWLDAPLALRLWRVILRNIRQRGQSRPDMADGCVERLDMLPGFLWFIVSTYASSQRKARAFYEATSLPKHRFTRAAQVNAFAAGLGR
jgi:adenylate kinase family enzyme